MVANKSAILTVVCLTAMFVVMLFSAWVTATYEISGVPFRSRSPVSITYLGFYIFVFLLANTALTTALARPRVLLAVPAAFIAGLAIASGPLQVWLFQAGIAVPLVVSCLVGFILSAGGAGCLLILFVGPVVGPLTTGCLTGLLVHFVARILAGQAVWDRPARREALANLVGFTIGAYVVFYSIWFQSDQLKSLSDSGAQLPAFVESLWPLYLAAPAVHLTCLWAARHRWGWPRGKVDVIRLLVVSLVMFLIVGAMRAFATNSPELMLTWPQRDFATIQFWKNPRRDEPLVNGDHLIRVDPETDVHRKWNRELRRYDSLQVHIPEDVWALTDARPGHLEIHRRELLPPTVPVKCDEPAPYGLRLCRPLDPDETVRPTDPTVPAKWIAYGREIFIAPGRPDILMGRSFYGRTEENSRLVLVYTEHRYPEISVQVRIHKFELARWREAIEAFDRATGYLLQAQAGRQ